MMLPYYVVMVWNLQKKYMPVWGSYDHEVALGLLQREVEKGWYAYIHYTTVDK